MAGERRDGPSVSVGVVASRS